MNQFNHLARAALCFQDDSWLLYPLEEVGVVQRRKASEPSTVCASFVRAMIPSGIGGALMA